MKSTALLLIDIQNDYFPKGNIELKGSEQAGLAAGKVLTFFRDHNLPVIFIQHISKREGATYFQAGTTGVEIHASVKPLDNELIIQKHFPNSFRETDLLAQLQQRDIQKLVIVGMMTHMCVDATTRAAADLGYKNIIAADACATRDLEFDGRIVDAADVHTAFLAALNRSYGEVMKVEDILQKLQSYIRSDS
jgi:nicotinamidase-related amidase